MYAIRSYYVNRRHELNMNPKGSPLAGKLGNLGFLFYLGASPAAAVVNMTQNATVMLPQLGGKFGFAKASAAMLKAVSDYARHGVFKAGTKEAWVSLTRAEKGISKDEKSMLLNLYKAGVLDLTQAHSIAARADTDQQNVNVHSSVITSYSIHYTKLYEGKPFATEKEAQMASRKTETPIALPTGGFGVVEKTELEQALSQS